MRKISQSEVQSHIQKHYTFILFFRIYILLTFVLKWSLFTDSGMERQKQSSVWTWPMIQVSLDTLCLPSVNWKFSHFQSCCLQSTDPACTLSPWIRRLDLPLWALQAQTSPTVTMPDFFVLITCNSLPDSC